jgi:MFS family permease
MDDDIIIKHRFPALQYRDFRLLWLGQFVSITGSQMQMVALNWHIYTITKSAIALGMIGLVRVIPIIIFSLIGGNFADVHNRKKIMFIANGVMACFSIILAFVTFTDMVTPAYIYVLTGLAAIAISFEMPARQAFVPRLVKREHLANAMSLNAIMYQTATIFGPAVAGFIIAHFTIGSVYAINAISFVAVLLSLYFIHTPGKDGASAVQMSFHSIKEGLTFVKSKTIIWSTMLLDFFTTFFGSATALLPIFAQDILHVGPQGLGILYASSSVGAVVAGYLGAHLGHARNQGRILLGAVAGFAVATVIFGLSKSFYLSCFALFFVGAGDSISMIIRSTLRQLETPDHIRGRMTSINMIFAMGGPQLGEFQSGILAALITAPLSVATGGTGALIVVSLMAYFIPTLRKYDNHEIHTKEQAKQQA